MSIRLAHASDTDALFALSCRVHRLPPYTELVPESHREAFELIYSDNPESRRKYYMKLSRYIDRSDAWASVYELDGKVVGFRLMYRDEAGLHLRGLYVDPEYQGRGIGTELFMLPMKYLRSGEVMELPVLEGNHRARRLYEKHGFVVTDEVLPDFCGMKQIQMKLRHIDRVRSK